MAKNENKREKTNYKFVMKVYWSFLRKHKGTAMSLLVGAIILQALYLVDKFIYKILVDEGTKFSTGLTTSHQFLDVMILLIVVYLGFILAKQFFNWIEMTFTAKLDTEMVLEVKQKYFNHLVDLDHDFHTTHKTGSLISRLNRCAGAIQGFNSTIRWEVLPFLVQIVILSAVFAYFSWIQTAVLLLFSAIYLTTSITISHRFQKYRKKINKSQDKEKGTLADIFTNISSVRYFGKNKTVKKIFAKLSGNTKKLDVRGWHYWRLADIPMIFISSLGFIILLVIPVRSFLHGEITLGTVTLIYTAYLSYRGALDRFAHAVRDISRTMTDMEDLFEYGKVHKNIKDKKDSKKLKIKNGEVVFENVGFGYKGTKKVFNKFNLKIPKNKTVALVGQSGCGKSTLVNLLYRFYDVEKGKVLIDRKDIKNYSQETLRGEMAIVPQEAILFDDTIFNNLKFANPKATKKEVWQAMKFAQLDKFVKELPKKEKTIVGERGVKLSGGQKQRVSIARAILANKKILVLDEATSALDSETEWEIQKDLRKLMKGRTSIVIAHRLSTIMHADIIVVMKDGKIIQKGTHRELISRGGEYSKLWEFQKGGFISE